MNYYSVRFFLNQDNHKEIGSILGLGWIDNEQSGTFEFKCALDYDYWFCLNKIIDLIQEKFVQLESICIVKDNISIWLISEISEQTNFEFSPEILEKLGKSGVHFCISLY